MQREIIFLTDGLATLLLMQPSTFRLHGCHMHLACIVDPVLSSTKLLPRQSVLGQYSHMWLLHNVGVICRLMEGSFCPIIQVTGEGIKHYPYIPYEEYYL